MQIPKFISDNFQFIATAFGGVAVFIIGLRLRAETLFGKKTDNFQKAQDFYQEWFKDEAIRYNNLKKEVEELKSHQKISDEKINDLRKELNSSIRKVSALREELNSANKTIDFWQTKYNELKKQFEVLKKKVNK